VIEDSGKPDEAAREAEQWNVDRLPDDALVFLLGSRYCDTQKLSDFAWAGSAALRAGGGEFKRFAVSA
jgi:hypothetical protein